MEVCPLDFDLKKYFHFISFELKDKFLSTFAFISQSRERFWVPHPKKFPSLSVPTPKIPLAAPSTDDVSKFIHIKTKQTSIRVATRYF